MGQRRSVTYTTDLERRRKPRTLKELKGAYPFSDQAIVALHLGHQAVGQFGHASFGSEHFLLGLTHRRSVDRIPQITPIISRLALSTDEIWAKTEQAIGHGSSQRIDESELAITPSVVRCADSMEHEAGDARRIDIVDMMTGLVNNRESVAAMILAVYGVNNVHDLRVQLNDLH